MAKTHVIMKVNGAEVEGLVEPRMLLVHFIRENLSLTGTHIGCETTHCGACTVDIDGMSVKSCTMFAVQAQGSDITTIEGMANADGSLHALQEGFRMMHGLQCGFCTPGMIIRAQRLLKENPQPSEQEIRMGISGNICRCTGYQNIVKAIQYAPPRSMAWNSRRPPNERLNSHAGTTHRCARRHGLQAQARRRYPLHARPGQLRRRRQIAGHAAWRLRSLAACA